MSKRLKFGKDSREDLITGINIVADAVSSTMGAMGRNVVVERAGKAPHVTKDGYSVAKEIFLSNAEQNLGAQMIKGVSAKTVDDVGDGTSTSTILARAMITEGLKYLDNGSNPVDLKRGIEQAVYSVVASLEDQSQPVKTKEQIKQVATIAANNDGEIGDIVEEAISKVSREGTITVEESKSFETYVDTVEGLKLHRGLPSIGFVTDVSKGTAVLENPLIFMTPEKIESVNDILPMLQTIPDNRSLLVIGGELSGEFIATMVINKVRGGIKLATIKAPFLGEKRNYTLEDLAVITGGKVVSEAAGLKFEDFTFDMLGSCDKVVIDKDSTVIINGHGEPENIETLKADLRNLIESTDSKYEVKEIKDRLALVSGGVAVIYVGANSEIEIKEKMDRIDDALGATRAAIEEGIVAGGGIALLNSAKNLLKESLTTTNEDIKLGYHIVFKAIQKPTEVILNNAGEDYEDIMEKLSGLSYTIGYDVKSGEFVDMVEKGIIDPKKVTRVALENAASVAALVLMTECTIVNEK